MRIAVIGAGGLGGYFGGRLAVAGQEVHFLARGAHLAAMQAGGLTVESVLGDFVVAPSDLRATDDPVEIGPVDVVLFTVKSFDTTSAAAHLGPLLGSDTAVISLQNGIDNEDRLVGEIGPEHVAGGVAYIFAGIAGPGLVRHTGGPARILFGELDGRDSPRLQAFLGACEGAGIDSALVPDIRVALWTKYAFICAMASLTAATRQPVGVIRETSPTWELFRQVLSEVGDVGRAEGVTLPDDLVARHLAMAMSLQPNLYSSLHDDLVSGRRMEVEALLGEIVRRAGRVGVRVPVCSVLYAILLPQANAIRAASPRDRAT